MSLLNVATIARVPFPPCSADRSGVHPALTFEPSPQIRRLPRDGQLAAGWRGETSVAHGVVNTAA